MKGTIFQVDHESWEEGEGIRRIIYIKGCPMYVDLLPYHDCGMDVPVNKEAVMEIEGKDARL